MEQSEQGRGAHVCPSETRAQGGCHDQGNNGRWLRASSVITVGLGRTFPEAHF